jgi:hypothetical protein
MTRARVLTGCLTALAALSTAACGDQAPTGVETARVSAAMTKTEERQLKRLEESEKYRIWVESERSKRTYDSLKVEWDRFLKKNHSQSDSPYLMCDPLQYAADVKIIGPEGGDMSVGPHKLSIPKGALSKHVVITGEMPVSTMVDVKFSPHGLQFLKQPTLELSYKHCYRPKDLPKAVAYHDDDMNILEWPTSSDYAGDGLVKAWIEHFSGYAVAHRSRRGY